MTTLDELKQIVATVDPADLEDACIGDIYEIEGIPFKVLTIKPVNIASHRFAVELRTEEGWVFGFMPVIINDYQLPKTRSIEDFLKPKRRKNRNRQKYEEIYEKSKTVSSYDLAKEYDMTYAMIRYVIRKMKKEEN